MAPDRIRRPMLRGFVFGLIAALAIVTVTLSVIVTVLYGRVTDAERRVRGLELASRTSEVASCYVTARGRPPIIRILRGLAVKLDPDPRDAINDFIDELQATTPRVMECDDLARRRGFKPSDFPAPDINKGGVG